MPWRWNARGWFEGQSGTGRGLRTRLRWSATLKHAVRVLVTGERRGVSGPASLYLREDNFWLLLNWVQFVNSTAGRSRGEWLANPAPNNRSPWLRVCDIAVPAVRRMTNTVGWTRSEGIASLHPMMRTISIPRRLVRQPHTCSQAHQRWSSASVEVGESVGGRLASDDSLWRANSASHPTPMTPMTPPTPMADAGDGDGGVDATYTIYSRNNVMTTSPPILFRLPRSGLSCSRFYVVTPTNASTLCIDPRLGQCNQHMNNAITRTRYC